MRLSERIAPMNIPQGLRIGIWISIATILLITLATVISLIAKWNIFTFLYPGQAVVTNSLMVFSVALSIIILYCIYNRKKIGFYAIMLSPTMVILSSIYYLFFNLNFFSVAGAAITTGCNIGVYFYIYSIRWYFGVK